MAWAVWILLGALLAGLSVCFGAFGAHSLRDSLEPKMLQVFETAARYQMYHALALCFIGFLSLRVDSVWLKVAAVLMILGVILFSGSLYLVSVFEQRHLGVVTPVGGVLLILAWLAVVASMISVLFLT